MAAALFVPSCWCCCCCVCCCHCPLSCGTRVPTSPCLAASWQGCATPHAPHSLVVVLQMKVEGQTRAMLSEEVRQGSAQADAVLPACAAAAAQHCHVAAVSRGAQRPTRTPWHRSPASWQGAGAAVLHPANKICRCSHPRCCQLWLEPAAQLGLIARPPAV